MGTKFYVGKEEEKNTREGEGGMQLEASVLGENMPSE